MKPLARSRSENGGMEATRGLCSTAPVQPSAKGAAPEGVELVHARTRPQGREGGDRDRAPRTWQSERPQGTCLCGQGRGTTVQDVSAHEAAAAGWSHGDQNMIIILD